MIPDSLHAQLIAHHAAIGAHAEPEVAPLVATVASGAVPVEVRELPAQRLAVEGAVEGGAAGHGCWVEGGGGYVGGGR